jgi:hypothetical protein
MRFENDLQRELYYRSQIDYAYYLIKELSKHTAKPESPLNMLIDKATGYDKHKLKENIKLFKYWAGVVIRCKGKIGLDNSRDKEFLKGLKKLEKKEEVYCGN